MTSTNILLLEDEPLILMDLQFAAEDRGCNPLIASSSDEALAHLASDEVIDAAILDVSLGDGKTCCDVAQRLEEVGIPYLLHSGDLDRHDELIRSLNAAIIAKPAATEDVIAAVLDLVDQSRSSEPRAAAE